MNFIHPRKRNKQKRNRAQLDSADESRTYFSTSSFAMLEFIPLFYELPSFNSYLTD